MYPESTIIPSEDAPKYIVAAAPPPVNPDTEANVNSLPLLSSIEVIVVSKVTPPESTIPTLIFVCRLADKSEEVVNTLPERVPTSEEGVDADLTSSPYTVVLPVE
tara:strand:+ start:221 stop:535 length:315 start_codon:yes stop_codon:yes gene_type:complete